jgi:lysophospholipase L1-like esterase
MTNSTGRSLVLALFTAIVFAAAMVRAEKPPDNTTSAATAATMSPSAKFEKEIAAYEAADKKSPPPQGAVLFIGDSGIKKWTTLAQDFPDQKVINRGFGGSQMADASYFADRIVIPYKPRLIVLREGGNDLTAGKTAEQLLADLKAFVAKVHTELPDTRIAVFSLNPNPARWNQAEKRKAANILLKAYVEGQKGLEFIEVWDQFLGPDGKPREDLFQKDQLHNNAEGNKLYAAAVRSHLK